MAIGKRKEISRGNKKAETQLVWVNGCSLSHNQVSNAVGKVIDSRTMEDLKFYLVRTLLSDPHSVIFEEATRISSK